ncbi:hypothetical protein LGM57_10615 [Burkholderia cepacia]|uniref:hypothetical protein n=1 Tax=Burkholderia cepacia TaxID=292 RepID=UPI001CF1A3E3|nr:hypothetical protein [Burkholderia cepacia]MCA7976772.1 hypothetical protein [Burkholderia cepacia]
MKITDDMLTEWRKEFETWVIREGIGYVSEFGHGLCFYESGIGKPMWQAWQRARRTTPDRDSIIEECAKVMDDRATEIEANGNLTSMTMGRIYRAEAEHIRALKTAPNGEKG